MEENTYEVIIPERRYIVKGLEEVRIILNKYKLEGVFVKLRENNNGI